MGLRFLVEICSVYDQIVPSRKRQNPSSSAISLLFEKKTSYNSKNDQDLFISVVKLQKNTHLTSSLA